MDASSLPTFRPRGKLPRADPDGLACLAAAGDRRFVTGGADGAIRVWNAAPFADANGMDTDGGVQPPATDTGLRLDAHLLGVSSVRVGGPTGELGVSCSQDGVVALWQVGGDDARVVMSEPGDGVAVSLCVRADIAVAVGSRGQISMIDTIGASVRDRVELPAVEDSKPPLALSVAVDAEDALAIVGAADGAVALVDIAASSIVYVERNAHIAAVHAVTCSSLDPQVAVTAGDDQLISQYDPRSRSVTSTARGHTGPITSMAFAHNSQHYFASSSTDHTIRVWDRRTMETVFQARDHKDVVNAVEFLSDDTGIVSVSEEGSLAVYDFSSAAD